jgi:transcriptional regulator with XRE-family HTH domain
MSYRTPRTTLSASNFFVRFLFDTLEKRKDLNMQALADRVGVVRATLAYWRTGDVVPKIDSIRACLNELGYELAIVPIKEGRDLSQISPSDIITPS